MVQSDSKLNCISVIINSSIAKIDIHQSSCRLIWPYICIWTVIWHIQGLWLRFRHHVKTKTLFAICECSFSHSRCRLFVIFDASSSRKQYDFESIEMNWCVDWIWSTSIIKIQRWLNWWWKRQTEQSNSISKKKTRRRRRKNEVPPRHRF